MQEAQFLEDNLARIGYDSIMTTVLEIERAIERLPAPEMDQLAAWFDEFRASVLTTEAVFLSYDIAEGEGPGQWIEEPAETSRR